MARTLQSDLVRRLLSRLKVDSNLIAIVTTILSGAVFVFFTVTAINAAGVPLSWNAPLPGVALSLFQIFLLIALLVVVFWFSSRTKRFLFNRFLAQSGLDRSLQYAIAQIISNVVLIVGIFIVLDNAGHSSRRTRRFCRRSWRRGRLWSAKHREQFHQRPGHPGGKADHNWRPRRSCRDRRSSAAHSARAARSS